MRPYSITEEIIKDVVVFLRTNGDSYTSALVRGVGFSNSNTAKNILTYMEEQGYINAFKHNGKTFWTTEDFPT